MNVWQDFMDELALWQDAGKTATLWWRDDDAVVVTPELLKLLDIAASTGTAPGIAVIPDLLMKEAADELTGVFEKCPGAAVLLHGFAHVNHAPNNQKSCEFGDLRNQDVMQDELQSGIKTLSQFNNFLPVFVPPWNRAGDKLIDLLAPSGITALSTFQPRRQKYPRSGLRQVNAHIDIINWKGDRGFVGLGPALSMAIDHLKYKRLSNADDEPTGVLSHHLVHDDRAWGFLLELMLRTQNHPAVCWLTPSEVFQ